MGKKVPVEDLRERAAFFFKRVVDVLVERNEARGDSYLEMDLDDLASMFRDKGGRVRTCARQDLSLPAVRRELLDSIIDEAGYAALGAIWVEVNLQVSDEEWTRIFRKVD